MLEPPLEGCKISPTYLSTNLLSPLRTPYRDTVPKQNILSGGTSVLFKPKEWGALRTDYGGIGTHYIEKSPSSPLKFLSFPRSHRHFIAGFNKVLHDVVQTQRVTSLLRSNCRQNDQFIDQPNHVDLNSLNMREENKFVQEPSYSSHICRSAMFPLSEMEEYQETKLPSPPLSQKTKQELRKVIKRRFKISSYEKDYDGKQERDSMQPPELMKSAIGKRHAEVPKMLPNDLFPRHAVGTWPSWPASRCYIVSNVTGQIVEKRDVLSLDDLRDFRRFRMLTHIPKQEERQNCSSTADPTNPNNTSESKDPALCANDSNSNADIEETTTTDSKNEQNDNSDAECENENHEEEDSSAESADDNENADMKDDKPGEADTGFRERRTEKKWRRTYKKTVILPPPLAEAHAYDPIASFESQKLKREGMTTEMLKTNREEETLYLFLKSLLESDKNKPPVVPHPPETPCPRKRTATPEQSDPEDRLHQTLTYAGNRVADRLGVRYKTVATKRYHNMHLEGVPDLRDFRPPVRKCKFLGYHTSTFR